VVSLHSKRSNERGARLGLAFLLRPHGYLPRSAMPPFVQSPVYVT
jgi:hypothetical protein